MKRSKWFRLSALTLAGVLLAYPLSVLAASLPATIQIIAVDNVTEDVVTLSYHCVKARATSRTGTPFKIAFVAAGEIAAGRYKTVPANTEWYEDDLGWTAAGSELKLYILSTAAADTIEVEEWIGN